MRKILSAFLVLGLFQPSAFGFCKNLSRLVCAEYSNSKLVVTAKLIRTKHVMPRDVRESDGFIYTLETTSVLKGRIGHTFQVYEENSSGRASFGWVKSETYLLFLDSNDDGTWSLYGCGNSTRLKEAKYALRAIEFMKTRKGGLVYGVVEDRYSNPSLEDVSVEIRGGKRTYKTGVNKYGEFKIHVPAGHYVVRVVKEGWKFEMDPVMTFEDPNDVKIENGGGAQVAFLGAAQK
jgi:hypothetical protein